MNKKLADAYFWRGVTKVKLRMPRSVQDFNKSLAIDPTLFQVGVTSQYDVTHGKIKLTYVYVCSIVYIQAYLARAAYYGMKGIYTKAILNCNEAIKLQPTSVRSYMYRCVKRKTFQLFLSCCIFHSTLS